MKTIFSKSRVSGIWNTRLNIWILLLVLMPFILTILLPQTVQAKNHADELDVRAIESFIQKEMGENRIPGLGLGIVHKDQVAYTKGFGTGAPDGKGITAQTPFRIGSMSKSITALAIMQLVEAGKIELDKPVRQYLPWFQLANAEASAQITVRHLLNQTSGIPSNTPQEGQEWLGEPAYDNLEGYVRSLKDVQALAPAGTQFTYANANYSTLGLMVEKVSGQAYGEYVQRNIFEPLGMKRSFTNLLAAEKAGLATGYQAWFGIAAPSQQAFSKNQLAAGYVMSSVEDMSKFLVMQMNNGSIGGTKIVSAEGVKTMHTPPEGLKDKTEYGMGWVQGGYTLNDTPLIWHNGSVAHFTSMMVFSPRSEWGVVVLSNTGGLLYMNTNIVEQIAGGVLSRLEGGKVIDPNVSVGTIYLWIDGIAAVFLIIQVWSLVGLSRWRKKFEARLRDPKRRWLAYTGLVLNVLFEPILAGGILIFLGWDGFKTWRLFAVNMPDIAWYLLIVLLLILVTGLIRVFLAWRTMQHVRRREPVASKVEVGLT